MSRIVVGIFIANAPSQLLMPCVVGIPQIRRNRQIPFFPNHCISGHNGLYTGIGFLGGSHIGTGLGQNDLGLRHANSLHRKAGAGGQNQGLRIRISHILRRANHNSSGNNTNILSGLQHFRKIIYRRLRIRSPHGFDKSGNGVIMLRLSVITKNLLLHTLRHHLLGDTDFSAFGRIGTKNGKLQSI